MRLRLPQTMKIRAFQIFSSQGGDLRKDKTTECADGTNMQICTHFGAELTLKSV